jgi:hypothetical protein
MEKMRRLTLQEMQNIAKERNGKYLSKIYINADTKYKWKCGKGHIWFARFSDIKSGSWCPKCYCESIRNEGNNNWSGNNVTKDGIHDWIQRHKTKSKLCEKCKQKPPYDLANISGKYKRDINDFEWLCRKCHMKSDGGLDKLKTYDTYKNYIKKGIYKKCLICNNKIYILPCYPKTKKFCSIKCKILGIVKKGIYKKCIYCNKKMYVSPAYITIRHFCSNKCKHEFRIGKKYINGQYR